MKLSSVKNVPDAQRRFNHDAELAIELDGEIICHYRLQGKRIVIGRSPQSDLCITNRYLSWKHAIIDFDQSGAFIVDLCSKNKTMVNDVEIDRAPLRDGDVIKVGLHRLHFSDKTEGRELRTLNGSAIDTSPDTFRAFNDSFHEDPNMLADDLTTDPLDEDVIPLDCTEPPAWAATQVLADPTDDISSDLSGNDQPNDILITRDEVESEIAAAASESRNILDALCEKFEHGEQELTGALGLIFDYKTIDSHELMQLSPDFSAIDLASARDHKCVLISDTGSTTVIICDPFDQDLRPWLESRFPGALHWLLTSRGDLNAFIARHEQSTKAMDAAIHVNGVAIAEDNELDDLSLASISHDSSPVVKLVHSTLYDALRAGASDIHMESGNATLEIRYRIDGVLAYVASVSGRDVAEQVISRVKVMSELDIAERRIPQDGRFKSAYDGRPIDFRVSIMPSSFGEDAVLRVLDKQAVTDQVTELNLDSLGFEDSIVSSLRKLSERPYGMLLVTGPTGSGKTTTLYGAISETNSGLGKIVTIEDPVEYQLPGVLQIPVNEKKGLTFARGLRSILRHDPDKIMVGEIRDPDTAQIAIQSALTGHLVFTTVHANNVFDVLSRFLHMGVDAYSFVSALNGILAQRLLRIVCNHCGEKIQPTALMLEATGVPIDVARTYQWRAGQGCSECRGTGYRGRRAVGELLVLNDELREAIIGRVPVRQLKVLAEASGVQFIRTAALNLVRDGLTTMEEVDRVTTMA